MNYITKIYLLLAVVLCCSYNTFGQCYTEILIDKDGNIIGNPYSGTIGEVTLEESTMEDYFNDKGLPLPLFTNPSNTTQEIPSNLADYEYDRIVYWMHGLNGNGNTLDVAGEAIQNDYYHVYSDYPSFSSLSDIPTAASNVRDYINAQNNQIPEDEYIARPDKSFIIAKSLGGIVSRKMYKMYEDQGVPIEDRPIKGLVTLGSHHQGAPVIDNRDDILAWSQDGCEILLSPLVNEAISETSIIDFFVDNELVGELVNTLCDLIVETIFPLVLPNLGLPIAQDIGVEGSIYTELNNAPFEDLPQIAFYGEEQDPVSLRTMYSQFIGPSSFSAFTADDDDDFILKADRLAAIYLAKANTFEQLIPQAIITENWCDPTPNELTDILVFIGSLGFYYLMCNVNNNQLIELANELAITNSIGLDEPIDINNIENFTALEVDLVADAYLDGFNWISDIDVNWRIFTGADIITEELIGYNCSCGIVPDDSNIPSVISLNWSSQEVVQNQTDCQEFCNGFNVNNDYDIVSIATEVFEINIDSYTTDGIVPSYSAANYPGSMEFLDDNNKSLRILEGSNHQQMNNDSQLKEKLILLFDGELDPFFETAKRGG